MIFLNREIPSLLGNVSIFLIKNLVIVSVNLFRYMTLISPTELSKCWAVIDNTSAAVPCSENVKYIRRLIFYPEPEYTVPVCFHRTDASFMRFPAHRRMPWAAMCTYQYSPQTMSLAHACEYIREMGDVFAPDGFKKRQHHQYLPDAL